MKESPIIPSLKKVFKEKSYRLWFVVLTVALVALYIFLPVWLTPGNDISFQLTLFRPQDYIMFLILSLLTSTLLLMQVFIFTHRKSGRALAVGEGSVGVFSSIIAGLFSTTVCPACAFVILGFFGAGGIFFVVHYQTYFVYAGTILVLLALYMSMRRIEGHCKNCSVPEIVDANKK